MMMHCKMVLSVIVFAWLCFSGGASFATVTTPTCIPLPIRQLHRPRRRLNLHPPARHARRIPLRPPLRKRGRRPTRPNQPIPPRRLLSQLVTPTKLARQFRPIHQRLATRGFHRMILMSLHLLILHVLYSTGSILP